MEGSNNFNKAFTSDDEINLRDLILKVISWWNYLIGRWRIILIAILIGGVLGLGYAYKSVTTYKASLNFVLEEQNTGSVGSMSSLASMIGISLGGLEGAGLFSNSNIMEFIKSKRIIKRTLLTSVDIDGTKQLLVDRYVKMNNLKESWKNSKLENFHFVAGDTSNFIQDSILNQFYKSILKNNLLIDKSEKSATIIQLDIESEDELFSKMFCESLIKNVTDFYIQTRTKKSAENLSILTKQVDSVRSELNAAIGGVASAAEANPNPNSAFQTLRVPSQRRQVDVQANSAILSELVKQQEIARLNLRNDKPIIQILDKPSLPLDRQSLGKLKAFIVGAFFSGFLVITYLIIHGIYIEVMKQEEQI